MINLFDVSNSSLWLGSEASYQSLLDITKNMTEASKEAFSFYDDDEEEENTDKHFLLDMTGTTAVISVKGKLVPGVQGSWASYWGVVGYGDIRNAAVSAVNQGAKDIIFDYDTGGGAVNGISEMSEFIKSLPGIGVSTISYSGGNVMSGGLWLATASESFYTAPMAEIGSLGVIAVTAEMTELYKKEGISVEVHKSSPLKAAGNPYEKLTEEGRAEIQKNIMETHEFFIDEIAGNRALTHKFVSEEIANGKTWFAAEAQKLGLVDGIKSFESIFLALQKESADNHSFQHVEANEMARKKQILDDKGVAAIASGVSVDVVAAELEKDAAADIGAGSDGVTAPEDRDKSVEQDPGPCAPADGVETAGAAEDKEAETADTALSKQVEDLQTKLVDLKVDLKLAERTNTDLKAAQVGFMEVTAAAIQHGYVAIGSPPPDLAGLLAMDASALLVQHATVKSQVDARYRKGGQVTVTVDDNDEEVDAAAKKVDEVLMRQAQI